MANSKLELTNEREGCMKRFVKKAKYIKWMKFASYTEVLKELDGNFIEMDNENNDSNLWLVVM